MGRRLRSDWIQVVDCSLAEGAEEGEKSPNEEYQVGKKLPSRRVSIDGSYCDTWFIWVVNIREGFVVGRTGC
jgi:hypothetical protein